jgi:signal transduction histidine kinase
MLFGLKSLYRSLYLLFHPPLESAEYQAWRRQFLRDRLQITLNIAFPVLIISTLGIFWTMLENGTQFTQDGLRWLGDASVVSKLRMQVFINLGVIFGLLLICWRLLQSHWGKRQSTIIFCLISSSLTWSDMIVGTFLGIPSAPQPYYFLVVAVLIPVHWRLHLLTQLLPIFHYLFLYRLLGLTKIGQREFYDYSFIPNLIGFSWIGLICILSVYLYEKLKRSEFELQRQLRGAIRAISHDLKNPAMGISVTLQGLLLQPDQQISLDRHILETLLAGSERQVELIDSLLEVQSVESGSLVLHCQPLDLSSLVNDVVEDLGMILKQHDITVANYINPNLPMVNADKIQIWQVFSNLLSNVLKHNPNETQVEISAALVQRRNRQWIRCMVQDNGIGIPATQLPDLFRLYTRGAKAKRMPGLGLGLYLCQQIITAHQGEIGVLSQPNAGSCFWLTLPIASSLNQS